VSYAASQVESRGESFIGDSSLAAAKSGTDGGMICSQRLPLSRMSPEFGKSQVYPCTVEGGVGVFSLVTAPQGGGG
jgi:hypothetical protein